MIVEAVVPVAGLGTRLLPATRAVPKEMLPVVDRPVVQYVVEELAAAGIRRVLFITGRRKRAIEDHFDPEPELEVPPPAAAMRFLYTRQPDPRGLGDAIRCAEGFASDRPVVVALGDAMFEGAVVGRLIEAHEATGAAATVAVTAVPEEEVDRYGIVVGDPRAHGLVGVSEVVEKPAPGSLDSRLAVAARYVIGPEVFAALRDAFPGPTGEIELAEALSTVIRAGGRVVAVPLQPGERRHDVGTLAGYCRTFLEYAMRHPELGPGLRAHASALLDAPR